MHCRYSLMSFGLRTKSFLCLLLVFSETESLLQSYPVDHIVLQLHRINKNHRQFVTISAVLTSNKIECTFFLFILCSVFKSIVCSPTIKCYQIHIDRQIDFFFINPIPSSKTYIEIIKVNKPYSQGYSNRIQTTQLITILQLALRYEMNPMRKPYIIIIIVKTKEKLYTIIYNK